MAALAKMQIGLTEQDFTEYKIVDVHMSLDAILVTCCCQPYDNYSIWNV